MKKVSLILLAAIATSTLLFSCHKNNDNGNNISNVTETQVITDFVQKIALPQYQNLQEKATALNNAVQALNANTTDANLHAAQQAWRDTRTGWETCEGFLLGPVEDNNYDPNMDTWPVDYLQLDSILATTAIGNYNTTFVSQLNQNLRGFHPLEFILWGQTGNATADSITADQKAFMVALSQDILNTVDSLNNSWATTGGNFQQVMLSAGPGNTRYPTKQSVILAIVNSMSDICNEVGVQNTDGKIFAPFSAHDSTQTESPFSHNSLIDFRNNIMGAQNVYLCTWNGVQGGSISAFVSARNVSLDNTIKADFTAAISALNNINGTFETAIYTEPTQLTNAMNALNTLQSDLDGKLKQFVTTYVKD